MNEDRRREFEALLTSVASWPRPKLDYSQMPESALLGVCFYHRLLTHQACYMVLLRTFAVRLFEGWIPEPVLRRGGLSVEDVVRWGRDLKVETLREAYCTYPHPGLFALVADLKMEGSFLGVEEARRLRDKPLTCELIQLDDGKGQNEKPEHAGRDLVRLLGLDKPRSYFQDPRTGRMVVKFRPSGEPPEETQQEALKRAFEEWRRPGRVSEGIPPRPPFPVPAEEMLPAEREFWEGPMGRVWEIGGQAFLKDMLPILTGEKESIGRRVRDHVFNEWATITRRPQILERGGREIASEIHSEPQKAEELLSLAEDLQSIRSDSERAYRIAIKRWKKRGRRFVEALSKGHSVTDASAHAGISRQTGHKYLNDLKQSLRKKNPAE